MRTCTCEPFLVYVHVFGDCTYAYLYTVAMLFSSECTLLNTHTQTNVYVFDHFFIIPPSRECLYLMSVQFVRISVVPHPLTYWTYSPVISK